MKRPGIDRKQNFARLLCAIRVGKNDARGATATLLTLRRVRTDNVLAGDGLASMFRLRNGLRGSQSRMA